MKPRVIVLQHVAMEGPARVAQAAARMGLELSTIALHRGHLVPEVDDRDVLVVMGGPMGVADVGNAAFAFLSQEVEVLRRRVNHRAPTLGICLGAQLIAHAAGARVYANVHTNPDGRAAPVIELGWAPVEFLLSPEDPVMAGLRPQETLLHWHGDTFDVPRGATHFATSRLCRNQAFHFDHKVFGLQFHCEVDAASVAAWVQEDAAYVDKARGPGGGLAVLAETCALTADVWKAGDQLLDNVFACMLR